MAHEEWHTGNARTAETASTVANGTHLRYKHEAYMRQISLLMTHELFLSGQYIWSQDVVKSGMLCIKRGVKAIMKYDKDDSRLIRTRYRPMKVLKDNLAGVEEEDPTFVDDSHMPTLSSFLFGSSIFTNSGMSDIAPGYNDFLVESMRELFYFLSVNHVSGKIKARVKKFFCVQWYYNNAVSTHELFKDMSANIQQEVLSIEMVESLLLCPLFQQCNRDFLQTVAASTRTIVLPDNEIVQHAADIGRDMYILHKGHCNLLNHLGRVVYTALTSTNCILLHVEYSALVQCWGTFPDISHPIIATKQYKHETNYNNWIDLFLYADIIVMSYVAYYNEKSLLVTHPLLIVSRLLRFNEFVHTPTSGYFDLMNLFILRLQGGSGSNASSNGSGLCADLSSDIGAAISSPPPAGADFEPPAAERAPSRDETSDLPDYSKNSGGSELSPGGVGNSFGGGMFESESRLYPGSTPPSVTSHHDHYSQDGM
ncbi:putative tetrameric potassium-selective cyclic nucleotide gated channel [Operophtera brumata]|uniref:Putative tetrameric potassium-selective cyclic nucleotide gated channel n=1 Tax=Operophtera brumata TaxID=104452 RepID=A0A0L7LR10_OPEBR|nr:putative tetrameric potassium-selective cyclic nucleotide gated channel [Operophtera brumata]